MSDDDDDEPSIDVREQVRSHIAAGFHDRDGVIATIIELFSDDLEPDALHDLVPGLYDTVHAQYLAEQAAWPAVTDCDRLDAAFDDLNATGIMARHDWTCCQTCGHGAMGDERDRVTTEQPFTPVKGYAFYHNQDTEAVVDGGPIFLAYGAADDASPTEIAAQVVACLNRHGLETQWNGSADSRIQVRVDWKRRSPPERWRES